MLPTETPQLLGLMWLLQKRFLDITNYLNIDSELHSEWALEIHPVHSGCVLLKLLISFSSRLWLQMIILVNLLLFFSFSFFLSKYSIALVRCIFWHNPSLSSGIITSDSLLRMVPNLVSATGKIIISKMDSDG